MDPEYVKYLRASNGDGPAATAFLSDDREVGDMSVITDNVLNWPSHFVATVGDLLPGGTVDVTSIFLGHLEGSIVMIDEFAPGYFDERYREGQTIFIKPASAWADIVAGLLEGGAVPPGGTTGQALVKKSDADGDVEWGSGGGVSIISKETPGGTVDETNTMFTTALPYVGGSLQVYVNGLAQSSFVTETDPAGKSFTLDVAPASGDNLNVAYQYAPSETGNADTVDGYHASAISQPNTIPVLNSEGALDVDGDIYSNGEHIFLIAHPVGSTYWNETDSRNPGTVWGGTWVALKGVVLGGISDASGSPFNVAAGTIIGADTHTLTINEMPSHTHTYGTNAAGSLAANGSNHGTAFMNGNYTSGSRGGSQAHNNIQRTLVGYLWKRTA